MKLVIDGVTYVTVARDAEVGDKVLISKVPSHYKTSGKVFTVSEFDYEGDLVFEETGDYFASHGDYVVLERIKRAVDIAVFQLRKER